MRCFVLILQNELMTMEENKTDISAARYLDIIFPWDDELCSYEPFDIENEDLGIIPMVCNGHWHGIIDLTEHKLVDCAGWPYRLQAKVRDEGVYTLLDERKKPICNYRGYVPALPFDDNSWGDYIHLYVGNDYIIQGWHGEFDFSTFIGKASPMTEDEYNMLLVYSLTTLKIYPPKSELEMLERAAHLMVDSHKAQVDKAGQSYILHPMRVALNCETTVQKTVAFLHDVIEDTAVSSADLRRQGFTDEVVEAVLSITRQPDEDYEAFIQRCALNPIGRYVKIRDLEDNLNVKRLGELDYSATQRINKYLKALRFLKSLS